MNIKYIWQKRKNITAIIISTGESVKLKELSHRGALGSGYHRKVLMTIAVAQPYSVFIYYAAETPYTIYLSYIIA